VLESTAALLLARTARAQRDGRAPSLFPGVVRDGHLDWSAARGEVVSPATAVQYRLGSISKTVCAVAVMRARDEGLLDLDDHMEQHLPGTPFGRRTLGQLLSHLASAGAETNGPWWERTPGSSLEELRLTEADRPHAAGRRFHYSNLGFGLGSCWRTCARPWSVVVRDEVLLPLGMTRTSPRPVPPAAQGFAVHPSGRPGPARAGARRGVDGRRRAAVVDAAFLLGDTADVLAAATLEEMCDPAGGALDAAEWSAYGLGVMVHAFDGRVLVGRSWRLDTRLPRRSLVRPGRADRRGVTVQLDQRRGSDAAR